VAPPKPLFCGAPKPDVFDPKVLADGAPNGDGPEDCARVPKLEPPKLEPAVDPKLPPVVAVIDPPPNVDVCPNPPLCPKGLGPPPKLTVAQKLLVQMSRKRHQN